MTIPALVPQVTPNGEQDAALDSQELLLAMQARYAEALPREAAHLVDHPMRLHGLGFETFEHSVTSDGVCTPAPETPCMSGYF